MSEQTKGGYGYVNDEEQIGSGGKIAFGGNFNCCFMTKFDFITNAGKDGAAGEAIDIVFSINGEDKNYRRFPVTKAFGKNNVEVTDPNSPEMMEEFKDWNAIMTHILSKFATKEQIVGAFNVPIPSFKAYFDIAKTLLPANFSQVSLDIFLGYQWQITGTNSRTFLEIPKKMKYGSWLLNAVRPLNAEGQTSSWKLVRESSPADSSPNAIKYLDEAGNVHPFTRNGWYANSNFANMQKDGEDDSNSGAAISGGTGVAPAPAPTVPSNW